MNYSKLFKDSSNNIGGFILRTDINAKLMIKCPACNKNSNEYNWSMQTAARFSIGEETCPTLIMVILETINGDQEMFAGYRVVCPRCYHGIDFEELELPVKEDILSYAKLVGEDYIQKWI